MSVDRILAVAPTMRDMLFLARDILGVGSETFRAIDRLPRDEASRQLAARALGQACASADLARVEMILSANERARGGCR